MKRGPRIWDEADNLSAVLDGDDLTASDYASAGLDRTRHLRWRRKFGKNYMKVIEERRAKRKRKAEAAKAELLGRTCDLCGLVFQSPSNMKAHKALRHERERVVYDRYDRVLGKPVRGSLAWAIASGTFRK